VKRDDGQYQREPSAVAFQLCRAGRRALDELGRQLVFSGAPDSQNSSATAVRPDPATGIPAVPGQ